MSLNNTNSQIFQLEEMGFKKLKSNSYKSDRLNPIPSNSTVDGYFLVSFEDLDVVNDKGQIRSAGLDSLHIDDMEISFRERRSLGHKAVKEWLVGEFDEQTGKIILLDGHHRSRAMLRESLDPKKVNIPIKVVNFPNELTRDTWMSKANRGLLPSKKSNNKDAIKFFEKHHKTLFSTLGNNPTEKEKRALIYNKISEIFPHIQKTAKKRLYETAILGGRVQNTRPVDEALSQTLQQKLWKRTFKPGGSIVGNECFIPSRYDPSRKTIMMKCIQRSGNNPTETMNIKILTWFNATSNFPISRKEALRNYEAINNSVVDGSLAKITEVIFPEQDRSKNINHNYIFNWDYDLKKFV